MLVILSLISLIIMPSRFIHVVKNSRIFFFFYRRILFHYVCKCISFIYSFICRWTLVVFLLWIMWQVTRGLRCLFETVFLFSSGRYSEVGLLGNMVVLFLIFWRTSILFSIITAQICVLTNNASGYPLHPCQHFLFLAFLLITTLTNVRWCRIVILILISLMISDEHLFMYLLFDPF